MELYILTAGNETGSKGGRAAYRHYLDTIICPVPLERMEPYLKPEETRSLEEIYGEEDIHVWGLKNSGYTHWKDFDIDDWFIFYCNGRYSSILEFIDKTFNRELAIELWGTDSDDSLNWEYVFFLANYEDIDLSIDDVHRYIRGYSNEPRQGITHVSIDRLPSMSVRTFIRKIRERAKSTG